MFTATKTAEQRMLESSDVNHVAKFFTWCPIRPLHGRAPYRSISAWSLACLTA